MKLTITIGDTSVIYELCVTDAPSVYDGSGVIPIYDADTHRYILVRQDQLQWQMQRNRSGLYYLIPTGRIPTAQLKSILFNRLLRGED